MSRLLLAAFGLGIGAAAYVLITRAQEASAAEPEAKPAEDTKPTAPTFSNAIASPSAATQKALAELKTEAKAAKAVEAANTSPGAMAAADVTATTKIGTWF